jgi:uncharacterized protein
MQPVLVWKFVTERLGVHSLRFEKSSLIPASAEQLFAWHARSAAFGRLVPPWENVELISHEGIEDGRRAVIRLKLGPFSRDWIAEHREYRPGVSFQDVQISGPFARWEHTHLVEPDSPESATLTDRIEYALPGGRCGNWLGGRWAASKIQQMFAWRHRCLGDDFRLYSQAKSQTVMNVLITGGSGLIGQELCSLLSAGGHQVTVLTRSTQENEGSRTWQPDAEQFDPGWFEGYDAVVHLAGENIAGKRWTSSYKQKLLTSRRDVTRKLAAALAQAASPPRTLISGSAVGWYGDRGDEPLTEQSAPGHGFLADVCREWEAAAAPAAEAGIRVVHPRIGVVLSPRGGALKQMLPIFKLGLGGVLGNGRQYMSWIGLDDVAGILFHLMTDETLSGPVNCVAPHPVTNREFTKTLGRVLSRPTIFPVPGFMAKLAFGEMADALLLSGAKILPDVLSRSGYEFRAARLEDCLRRQLGKTSESSPSQ